MLNLLNNMLSGLHMSLDREYQVEWGKSKKEKVFLTSTTAHHHHVIDSTSTLKQIKFQFKLIKLMDGSSRQK